MPEHSLDPVVALSKIEDDRDPLLEARNWAMGRILAGVTPEEVVIDLVEHGWNADSAEEIAEHARKETREQRGVVTREAVAGGVTAKYHRDQRRAAFVFRLLFARACGSSRLDCREG